MYNEIGAFNWDVFTFFAIGKIKALTVLGSLPYWKNNSDGIYLWISNGRI